MNGYASCSGHLADNGRFESFGVAVRLGQGKGIGQFKIKLDARFAAYEVNVEIVNS